MSAGTINPGSGQFLGSGASGMAWVPQSVTGPLVSSPTNTYPDITYYYSRETAELGAVIRDNVAALNYGLVFSCDAGLQVGAPVRFSGDRTVAYAHAATTNAAAAVVGFVASKPSSTLCFIKHFMYFSGPSGFSGFSSAGQPVYLTNTSGFSGSAGVNVKVVGTSISSSEAMLEATPLSSVSNSGSGLSGTSGFSGTFSGASGSSGSSGYSGQSGFSGTFSGFSGFSGSSGVTGASGLSGVSGFSARSGYSGISGQQGGSGYSGFSGLTGTSGFSGFSGRSGFSGISGQQGQQGVSGYSGISGSTGTAGTTGESGFSGYSGFSGTYSGFSGYSGMQADSGTSGFSGISGISGATGSQGLSGFSGFSGQGQSGFSGQQGIQGIQGISGFSGSGGGSSVQSVHRDTVDPDVNDDESEGFTGGSLWWNSTDKRFWVCNDQTEGAASWERVHQDTYYTQSVRSNADQDLLLVASTEGEKIKTSGIFRFEGPIEWADGGGSPISPSVESVMTVEDGLVSHESVKNIGNTIVPVATIMMWPMSTAPAGWVLCDGTAYSNSAPYADLYAVIGTTFGSTGGDFQVPNMSGRFPVGPDGSSFFVAAPGGNASVSSATIADTSLTGAVVTDGTVTGTVTDGTVNSSSSVNVAAGGDYSVIESTSSLTLNSTAVSGSITNTAVSGSLSSDAIDTFSIIPPYMCLNFIIKL